MNKYPIVPLGEVCDFVYGDGLKETDRKGGDVPVYGSNGIVGWHDEALTKGEALIVGRKGSIGEVHFSKIPCWAIDTTYFIEKTKVPCDFTWLYYTLKALDLTRLNKSAAIPGLNREDAYEQKIPLPPLTEQKRIASLLARADRLRQLRRTAHDLGDALLQSVFLEMFGDVAHSKWNKSELGELIEGFEAGVNYLPGSEGEKTSEWRVLKISAVTWGDFDPTESKAIREYEKFDETHIVQQGDLLISRANTTELVGAVSLVKIIPPKVLLPDKLWRVKFRKDSAILPEYTLHLLRQPELRKIIGDLATGSSGSMKNISMEKAYTLPIPVPPLSLQEEFAGVVTRVESLRGRMGESARQVEGLFESLLSESFGGKYAI